MPEDSLRALLLLPCRFRTLNSGYQVGGNCFFGFFFFPPLSHHPQPGMALFGVSPRLARRDKEERKAPKRRTPAVGCKTVKLEARSQSPVCIAELG